MVAPLPVSAGYHVPVSRAEQDSGRSALRSSLSQLGIDPIRRIHDLRHSFATFALRAGIATFDLSRYMGASLTMIDRHYGHLAKDGRQHAISLLDTLTEPTDVHPVDARWTRWKGSPAVASPAKPPLSRHKDR
jgi:hypothetical protein